MITLTSGVPLSVRSATVHPLWKEPEIVAGRHIRQPAGGSLFGPLATAVVVLALLVSGAFGAMKLTEEKAASTVGRIDVPQSTADVSTPEATSPTVTTPSPTPPATTKPKPTPTKTAEHASRGSVRAPSTKKATPEKTTTKPATDGTVVSSGTCGASYYDEGQMTANGEVFNPEALTAAHKTLAFNTRVRVTNPSNGKSVVVRINDRGPFVDGRCLDLSRAAFRTIADLGMGELTVKYDILDN
jgi:rare lipoprotein A